MTDWWQKREIDRKLTRELHVSQEAYRMATIKVRDMIAEVEAGILVADGNLALQQAYRARTDAFAVWKTALGRWTDFVKSGAIPEDLKSDGAAS